MAATGIMKYFIPLLSLVLFFTACTSQKVADHQLKRDWMLVEMKDFSKEVLVKNKAQMSVKESSGKAFEAFATVGCNQLRYELISTEKGKFKVVEKLRTERACDAMDLEVAFSKQFYGIMSYTVEGHFLTIRNQKGETMKFIASDWD